MQQLQQRLLQRLDLEDAAQQVKQLQVLGAAGVWSGTHLFDEPAQQPRAWLVLLQEAACYCAMHSSKLQDAGCAQQVFMRMHTGSPEAWVLCCCKACTRHIAEKHANLPSLQHWSRAIIAPSTYSRAKLAHRPHHCCREQGQTGGECSS
jgi:hypothetical protein